MKRAPAVSSAREVAGFTLIETMIAVAIIAILAAVAIPSYGQFVTQSRRADGMSELARVMARQERHFMNTLTYSADMRELGLSGTPGAVESEEGHYLVRAGACRGSILARCVTLTARPQGAQADDGWLSLDSRGRRQWEGNAAGESGWP